VRIIFSRSGCGDVFQGVSIVEVSSEFDRNREAQNRLAPDGSPDFDGEFESFEGREPNAAPRGLMRKRRHPIFWILLALLLGGFIALVLSALVTD
jgi:hypothetical protein